MSNTHSLTDRELRIGNLVNYRVTDELDERKEWFEPSVIDAEDLMNIDEDYQAIPLTEEWLIKFGFERKGCNWEKSNFRFHLNKPANYDGFLFCDGYLVITNNIYFVHQLQNLYFALTNNELELINYK